MTDLELIFSMLGERATTEITQTQDSQGFKNLKKDAKKALENKTGKSVATKNNYLQFPESQKKITEI